MPRLARVVCPGLPYHVTQRGNRRATVFFSDHDRRIYLDRLQEYAQRASVEVLAYCLMNNHVHLVLVPATPQSLERALRPLHTRHAQRINRLKGWKGHVWQGRYFCAALDEDYLWAAMRYVEQNPIRAKLTVKAEEFPWSSAAAHCGLRSDTVLTAELRWRRLFAGVGDWSAWLKVGMDRSRLETLRRNTVRGLPCGTSAFIDSIEQVSGRALSDRPRGRPKKLRISVA